ncbi:MAG: hypothetical protein CMH56_09170 [Myxococcales bacterium]|nr:hypothetical protein [Myxococcales bacterium]|tara:strand:- start:231 stop:542 length:312 start_codon:yes stop_codon:yes gene_type:complete
MTNNHKHHFLTLLHLALFNWGEGCEDENEKNEFFIDATEAFFMVLASHLGRCAKTCQPEITLQSMVAGIQTGEHMHPRFMDLLQEAIAQVTLENLEPENEMCS